MEKKPLEPLIPLEDFKMVLAGIARVPKSAVSSRDSTKKPEETRPKKS